jgi:hypothetical protein
MTNRRTILALSTLFCLHGSVLAQASFERLAFDSAKDPTTAISMEGWFAKSGVFSPQTQIFSISYFFKQSGPHSGWLNVYKFSGRTGEKTFDLLLTKYEPRGPKSESKISVYFDQTVPLPLNLEPIMFVGTTCNRGEGPALQMISLTGNQLEAQVLLPDCLKPPAQSSR